MDLSGKVVLVTGAAKRLGAEISRALAGAGARVAIHCRESRDEAAALAGEIGGEVFEADLANFDATVALPRAVATRMGGVDALVNSAAIFERAPFGEVEEAGWVRHLDINLRAPFFLAQEFWNLLPEGAEGRILNLTDARGDVMDANYPAYSLAKAGLQAMTRGLAVALAPRVRVFGLVLGHMLPVVGRPDAPIPDDALLPGLAPGGTTGAAAAFLLGPGDFATGSLFHLDGGRHLRSPGGTFRP